MNALAQKLASEDAGCITAVPAANDNVPHELRALGAAIGKWPQAGATEEGVYSGHPRQASNDNLPPVIALTGQAGSGKSTATRYLVEQRGYTLVKFAGPLKDMMRAIGMEEDEVEGALKETSMLWLCGKTPRHAMQTLGTQWGRDCIGKDFWLNLWGQRALQALQAGGRVVVDDCRFPNEAKAVRRLGGDIFKLVGRGGIPGSHESERGCGDEDLSIVNDGSIDELNEKIERALTRFG